MSYEYIIIFLFIFIIYYGYNKYNKLENINYQLKDENQKLKTENYNLNKNKKYEDKQISYDTNIILNKYEKSKKEIIDLKKKNFNLKNNLINQNFNTIDYLPNYFENQSRYIPEKIEQIKINYHTHGKVYGYDNINYKNVKIICDSGNSANTLINTDIAKELDIIDYNGTPRLSTPLITTIKGVTGDSENVFNIKCIKLEINNLKIISDISIKDDINCDVLLSIHDMKKFEYEGVIFTSLNY